MMSAAAIIDHPAVGCLAHEGIDLDAEGNVYVVDEHRGRTVGCGLGTPCGGGVYKFVPHTYGDLIMIEDNVPSDIWFASTKTDKFGASKDVDLFASLTDPSAEGTGIYFSPTDDKALYVNIQHSATDDGDATWAITRKGKGHWKDKD